MTVRSLRTGPGTARKLAINRLKERAPVDSAAIDRFLARNEVPIVEGARCTFLFRGEADEVFHVQRIVGLPDRMPMRRLWGSDLWYLVLELPHGSRVEYQIEIRRGDHHERFNDPLNPRIAHSPMGSSSVCHATGYVTPDWVLPDPDARHGELTELIIQSTALRRACAARRRRIRHQRLPGHRPDVRNTRAVRCATRGGPCARIAADHGSGREPHLRRASVVHRVQVQPDELEAGLVLVATASAQHERR
jgi:hypothetical protein